MNHTEVTERMHAVLDGVATPEQTRELERLLARDTTAQSEFEGWRRVFQALEHMAKASPPEGLEAAVNAALSERASALRSPHQLFARPGVLGHRYSEERHPSSRIRATFRRLRRSETLKETDVMSEEKKVGFRNRKLWAGGAAAALVLGVAIFTFDYPPKGDNVAGTIVPAERYQAPQAGADAIKLGDQTIAQLMQSDAFDRLIKDPEMQKLAKDANMRALASLLASNPGASQSMVANMKATQAAVANLALAQGLMADVAASQAALAAVQANPAAAASSSLAQLIQNNLQVSVSLLSSVDTANMVLANRNLAQAIAANAAASQVFMRSQAYGQALNSAEAAAMSQAGAASSALLQSAQAQAESHGSAD